MDPDGDPNTPTIKLIVPVFKIRKSIYRSNVQVTFGFYGHYRWSQVIHSEENYIY